MLQKALCCESEHSYLAPEALSKQVVLSLTKGFVEFILGQALIPIDVVVFEEVKQCALRDTLGQTFLLDHLQGTMTEP